MIVGGGVAEAAAVAASVSGGIAVIGGAFALGLRHGIDWDHIAAITDITSSVATPDDADAVLTHEPGLQLTDERHHRLADAHTDAPSNRHGSGAVAVAVAAPAQLLTRPAAAALASASALPGAPVHAGMLRVAAPAGFLRRRREPLLLGTLYALGHGLVVTVLGVIALLAAGILPAWVDGVMTRIVGVTLLFLAGYLYYSIYRYFRGGGAFRLRSRWMLVFAGVRRGHRWLRAKLHGHEHYSLAPVQQYGARAAFSIGLIHGIGAETGTQALVIATAVGAGSNAAAVAALVAFVLGLLVSNSVVTVASATGFVSASRRQWLYIAAGALAATFSLVLGVLFLLARDGVLPDLGVLVRWIGGPD